tara:strand:- start:73 stop:567 length:495 start_codon:yes stop_codon:yes gene_type:complete
MNLLDASLIFSSLLCTLVAGFILTYSVVVMPGLSKLDDKKFIRAFQVTDGIVQNNQPIFISIWLGSIISVVLAIFSSILTVGLSEAWSIIFVSTVYLIGVQGVTISIHLPLNSRIQKINIDKMTSQMLSEERKKFEPKWNFYNNIRTGIALIVSLALILIIAMR